MIRWLIPLMLLAVPVQAQETPLIKCVDHSEFVESMAEEPVWERRVMALKADGLVLEIYQGMSGIWLAVWTWPNGQTCPIDAGTMLDVMPGPGT